MPSKVAAGELKLDRHPIVNLFHVTRRYGRRLALHDVSLQVQSAEFVFLVGPSGAGKSTLLRLVYMEEFPTEGQVTVAEFVSTRMKRSRIPHLRRKVGLIFQDFKLLEDRDVYENVAFPLYVTGANNSYIRRTVLDLLGRVGLYQKRTHKPHELSGGEQQRVAIARALVNSPYVLLADEPTGNLDPIVAREILKLLFQVNLAGTAVIMATHDHETVRRYGQRIVHIEQGELVQDENSFERWSREVPEAGGGQHMPSATGSAPSTTRPAPPRATTAPGIRRPAAPPPATHPESDRPPPAPPTRGAPIINRPPASRPAVPDLRPGREADSDLTRFGNRHTRE